MPRQARGGPAGEFSWLGTRRRPPAAGSPPKAGATVGDQQAALIGRACFAPGIMKSAPGTGCFAIAFRLGDETVRQRHCRDQSHPRDGGGPQQGLSAHVHRRSVTALNSGRVKRRRIGGPACVRDDAGEVLTDRRCGFLRIEPSELQWRPESSAWADLVAPRCDLRPASRPAAA
jgi:hypothetical protein